MGKIRIKFGYPGSIEELNLLSERAIRNNYSIESELCLGFKCLLDSLNRRKGEENYFDLIFFLIVEKELRSPRISFDTYLENGYKLPMVVLEDEYLKVGHKEKLYISNEFINELGKNLQTEFDYEYVGFERY